MERRSTPGRPPRTRAAGVLERLVNAVGRAPLATLAVVGALAIAGGLAALSMRPSVASDTLISSSSPAYRATQSDDRTFGAAPVVVLVREPLAELLGGRDIRAISRLEACVGGYRLSPVSGGAALVPQAGARPYGGPDSACGYLMRNRPVRVVYGPGTFLNRAVVAIGRQLDATRAADRRSVERAARIAYRLALARGLSSELARAAAITAAAVQAQRLTTSLARLALSSGLRSAPSIANPSFIDALVFGQSGGLRPRSRLAYLFPSDGAALIQARLRADLTQQQSAGAIAAIRAAVAMPQFRLTAAHPYTVTGEPVVLNELANRITSRVVVLLIGAILAMALALLVVFGGPLALLPLGIALASTAVAFGALALMGSGLTIASLAALPILIGLAVDYGIQFQSRARERADLGPGRALREAAGSGGPALVVAGLATGAGFVALWLSPVPMVRGFATLIIAGIAIALALTLSVCSAALRLGAFDFGVLGASARGAMEIVQESWRGAGGILSEHGVGRLRVGRLRVRRPAHPQARAPIRVAPAGIAVVAARSARHPSTVLAVGAALALAGWLANSSMPVQTDVVKLIGGNTPALRDLATLQRTSGVSGEIDVMVDGPAVATPRTIAWMAAYERRLLAHFGDGRARPCAGAELCAALSLPDLFTDADGRLGQATRSDGSIEQALAAIPSYFSGAVLSANRRKGVIAFGVRLMPLAREQQLIDYMRARLHPPPGVRAELAGLPVLAADAGAALSDPSRRLLISIAGLAAVALALLVALRDPRRVAVPLVPIAMVGGWSALVLFLAGIPLDPLSATLTALAGAICTEFSVLLSERYWQERAGGRSAQAALRGAYRRTGAAALASGVTVVAGFAVLLLSGIAMLRNFGLVTVIDLSVSLAGVLLVLPAAIAVAEGMAPAPTGVHGEPGQQPRRRTPAPVA